MRLKFCAACGPRTSIITSSFPFKKAVPTTRPTNSLVLRLLRKGQRR